MESIYIFLIFLIVAGLIIFFFLKRGGDTSRVSSLRAECRRSLNMPVKEADETINRHLSNLREKHPGRSEEWYLDKLLYDLQRDRS